MDFLILFIVFTLGAIIGSFLNVVILRYNTGESIASGKSACFSCARSLSWHEMFPVLSFFALRGRCGGCKSKISWQYPMVEFFTGLLFLGVCLKFNLLGSEVFKHLSFAFFASHFYYFAVFSILIVITVYDFKHKIIPDLFVFSFAFISLIWLVAGKATSDVASPANWDLLAGPILALPFLLMWLLSGGRWMGLGDAKLALGMGWFLGLVSGVSAVILGFWIGAAISLILLLLQKLNLTGKNLTIKSEIPFAPFLILGLLAVFFFGFDVIGLANLIAQ
ncbi:MAG: prepilin peptidase [Patescibacteria group bacterium]